jgi:hypothetical protein
LTERAAHGIARYLEALHELRLRPILPWFQRLQAAMFIETIESRQGWKVCCREEIAYREGFIDAAQLELLARPLCKTEYGAYLRGVLREPS